MRKVSTVTHFALKMATDKVPEIMVNELTASWCYPKMITGGFSVLQYF
jgi:hypothetical protein